jgi:hypothetical protein
MEQPLYDIYFTGKLVEGVDTGTGKANLAALFKRSEQQIATFFDGKPHLLKRAIDKPGAIKYKAALHKAGLLVAVKAHQTAATQTSSAAPTDQQATTAASAASEPEPDWSLAPPGSDVLQANERKTVAPRDIDTSAIKMVPAFMSTDPEPQPSVPAPDVSHLSVAATGTDLLATKPPPAPSPEVNIDAISLAPAGTELEEIHPHVIPLNPDTSQLSLADAGAELLEGQTKATPPPAPNTDHLTVKPD